MRCNSTMCQCYIHRALNLVLVKLPEVLVIQYMDEILLSCLPNQYLNECLSFMVNKLKRATFKNSHVPDKIQKPSPRNYLGYQHQIYHHLLSLKFPKQCTLSCGESWQVSDRELKRAKRQEWFRLTWEVHCQQI